ncbi:MAG: hypothetical protein GY757_56965 [bacterium]|nr:hypothetical protein [bacterium]
MGRVRTIYMQEDTFVCRRFYLLSDNGTRPSLTGGAAEIVTLNKSCD